MASHRVGRRTAALLSAAALAVGWTLPGFAAPGSDGWPQAAALARIAGADRVATAVAVSQDGWDSADSVLIASAAGFADALAAASLAGPLDAPLLLTPPEALHADVAAEVERLGASDAVVLGGIAAVSDAVASDLAALGVDVERIAGSDRFATAAAAAAAAAQAAGATARHGVVASGRDHADALAAAGLLARGEPLLLTERDGLPDATADALDGLERVTVVGGSTAISDAVITTLQQRGLEVTRLAGDDRYATGAAIAAAALEQGGDEVLLVSGAAFSDALAAAALVPRRDAVILPVPAVRLTDGLDAFLRVRASELTSATIVGGVAAVGGFAADEAAAALAGAPRPGFDGAVQPLPDDVRAAMTGVSWREGCPVGLDALTLVTLEHFGFDGQVHQGRLVVASTVAEDVLAAFAALFDATFPLERVELVDAYGADDDASMAANNTSAFNCRFVGGTTTWSQHAYGTAIDLNPVQNPYVRGDSVDPTAGRDYIDRANVRPGMVVRPGPVVEAFTAIGWGWGGDWTSSKDYQHFSENGR